MILCPEVLGEDELRASQSEDRQEEKVCAVVPSAEHEQELEDEELQLAIALSLGEDDSQSEDRQEEKVIQSVAEHEQELEDEHLLQLAIGLSLGRG